MVFPAGAYNQRFQQEGIPTALTPTQARDFGSGLYRGVTSLGAGAIGDLFDMFPTQANPLMANAPRNPLAAVFGIPYDVQPSIAPLLQDRTYNTEEAAQALTNLGVLPQPTGSMEEQTGELLGILPYLAGPKAIPDVLDLTIGLGARGVGAGMRGLGNVLEQPSMLEQASDALLSGAIAADPRMNVMMAQGLMAPEPKFKQPDLMGFRSTVEDVVNLDTFPNRGSAEQMEAALGQKGGLSKPVTAQLGNRKIDKEELKFLGITDVLEEAKRTGQPVTKEQIQNVIESNRSNMYLDQEVLENIPSEPNLREEVIPYEEAEDYDYIQERINEHLEESSIWSQELAKNPDQEDAIREEIYNMMEQMYNEYPTKNIRLLDNDGDETEIYAIGSDGQGWWSIKNDRGETLTQNGTFETVTNRNIDRNSPKEIYSENEARVQLEEIAFERGYSGEGAKHRQYVAEDAANADSPIYGQDMGDISGEPTNYREIVVRSPETAGGDIGSHYGDDVAYHMRVSDRKYTPDTKDLEYEYDSVSQQMRPVGKVTRENALYVDEIQSDYAQAGAGRKAPLQESDKILLNDLDIDAKTKNLALSRFDSPETKAAREELLESIERKKEQLSNRMEWSEALEDKENYRELGQRIKQLNVFGQNLREQPLVAGQEKWVQHAVKNLITEMVETGKDRIIFTNGENQAKFWRTKSLEKFYDKILRNEVKDVLKGIDKDAFEMVDGKKHAYTDEAKKILGDGINTEPLKHISIKNTQKIKDFLEGVGGKPKGFGMYGAAPVAVGAGLLSGQQENENVLAPSL